MNSLPLRKSVLLLLNNAKCLHPNQIVRRTEYQSAYNLKNLYPKSSLKITTPQQQDVVSKDKNEFSGYIPMDKIQLKCNHALNPENQLTSSSGTEAELRFHLATADWIPEDIRKRLLEKKKNQLTKEGELILRSDKTHSYQLNVADVLQRLRTIIYKSHEPAPQPDPEWETTIRKRTERENEIRLRMKRHWSFSRECE